MQHEEGVDEMGTNGAASIVKASAVDMSRAKVASPQSMEDVFRLARAICGAAGIVPKAYLGDANKVAAAMITGMEMGMGAMEAMRSLHIIEGKAVLTSEVMLSRARQAGVRIRWIGKPEDAPRVAHLWLKRGEDEHEEVFTIEDAKQAGLAGKDNWRKYPKSMLRARCVSGAMRAFCPDVLGSGVYTDDEAEEIAENEQARRPAVGLGDAMRDGALEAEVVEVETLSELDQMSESLKAATSDSDVLDIINRWGGRFKRMQESAQRKNVWRQFIDTGKRVMPPMTTAAIKDAFAKCDAIVAPDGSDYLAPLAKCRTPQEVWEVCRGIAERVDALDPESEEGALAWRLINATCDRCSVDVRELEADVFR